MYNDVFSDENPHKQSWVTLLWVVTVRLVEGYSPRTFSCQRSLPYLPVPKLHSTVENFLTSVKPLYGADSKEYQELETQAKACFVISFIHHLCNPVYIATAHLLVGSVQECQSLVRPGPGVNILP